MCEAHVMRLVTLITLQVKHVFLPDYPLLLSLLKHKL